MFISLASASARETSEVAEAALAKASAARSWNADAGQDVADGALEDEVPLR